MCNKDPNIYSRSNHPSDVFKHMETIMTLVIEESDEIFELLRPLLASVKMKNKVMYLLLFVLFYYDCPGPSLKCTGNLFCIRILHLFHGSWGKKSLKIVQLDSTVTSKKQ